MRSAFYSVILWLLLTACDIHPMYSTARHIHTSPMLQHIAVSAPETVLGQMLLQRIYSKLPSHPQGSPLYLLDLGLVEHEKVLSGSPTLNNITVTISYRLTHALDGKRILDGEYSYVGEVTQDANPFVTNTSNEAVRNSIVQELAEIILSRLECFFFNHPESP